MGHRKERKDEKTVQNLWRERVFYYCRKSYSIVFHWHVYFSKHFHKDYLMEHYNTPGGWRRWGHLIVEETVAQVVSVLGQGRVASAVIYLD